jgi:hypothetical protein
MPESLQQNIQSWQPMADAIFRSMANRNTAQMVNTNFDARSGPDTESAIMEKPTDRATSNC